MTRPNTEELLVQCGMPSYAIRDLPAAVSKRCPVGICTVNVATEISECEQSKKGLECTLDLSVPGTNLTTGPFRTRLPEAGRNDKNSLSKIKFIPQPPNNPNRNRGQR